MVQKEIDVETGQQLLRGGRSVCAIHNNIHAMFQLLNMALTGVLMLVMWFIHPGGNEKRMKNILDMVASLGLNIVTDEMGRSTLEADIVLQSIHKLSISLHAVSIKHSRISTSKIWAAVASTTINSRCVRENGISSYRFISMEYIQCREWRLEALLENSTHRHLTVLNSSLESIANSLQ